MESLNIKGMLKNHHLAKGIADSSWRMFIGFLVYKAERYGRVLIEVPRNYPSSKLCSTCGYKNAELTLSDRRWKCPLCGTEHDRDVHAAINLYGFACLCIGRHACLKGGRVGLTLTHARGECSVGGMSPAGAVYEASLAKMGSSTFCKVE